MLWLSPIVAAPIILCIPGAGGVLLMASTAAAGLLLGITLPILIGLGQQMLPQSPRLGNSITMGLSWGIGGGLAALIVIWFKHIGGIEQAFPLFAMAMALSSGLCLLLRHPQ